MLGLVIFLAIVGGVALIVAAGVTHDPSLGQIAALLIYGGLTTVGVVVFIAILWIVGGLLMGGLSLKDRYHRFN